MHGLSTPDSTNFARFCQDVDNTYSATLNSFADLKVKHSAQNDIRTNEQIYIEVATGKDPGQYAVMGLDKVIVGEEEFRNNASKHCQHYGSSVFWD